MTNLSEDELIQILRSAGRLPGLRGWHGDTVEQIVALIKKPEVTEEWIEEKAKELHDKTYEVYPSIRSTAYWKDFIRLLVEEIK